MGWCSNVGEWESAAFIPVPCPEIDTTTVGEETGIENLGSVQLPIEETCDPTDCPLVEPTDGAYCGDWEGKQVNLPQGCLYGYAPKGCTSDDLVCTPSRSYNCGIKTETVNSEHTWEMEELVQMTCVVLDDPLYDTECDINDSGDANDQDNGGTDNNGDNNGDGDGDGNGDNAVGSETKFCPPNETEEGTGCTQEDQDQDCFYKYAWKGCTSESIMCMPSRSYTCETTERGDDSIVLLWAMEEIPQVECIADDPLWGTECNPICPDVQPAYGTDCSKTGAIPDGCPYDFIVVGCTAEDLKCVPISTYFCEFHLDIDKTEGSWTWQVAMMRRNLGVEYCADGTEDLPSGKCDPADDYA